MTNTFTLIVSGFFSQLEGVPPVEQGFLLGLAICFAGLAVSVVFVAFREASRVR